MAVSANLPEDVAVLCGGVGAEREVSLDSGAAAAKALADAGFRARIVDLTGAPEEIRALRTDIAFLALHGEFGEDGAAQRLLDEARIPYTGSGAASCALAMDKNASKLRFVERKIPTPRWILVREAKEIAAAMQVGGVNLPVVVKPAGRGSSVGTTIVRDASKLESAARDALRFDASAMVETFVDGRELTIGLLDGKALPIIELKAAGEFYDYEAKYKSDKTQYLCPAALDAATERRVKEIAESVFLALGAEDFARVDIMLGAEGPQVLELNSIPGFTSHSLLPKAAAAAGLSFPALCRRIVELAWARARKRKGA